MNRGKSEGKTPGPLFPRLHVKDTDKGGPKAPPRNKMALYEQLSLPSTRVKDAPNSLSLSLPPIYGGKLANICSSTQGHGLEKSRCHINVRQGSFSTDRALHESNEILIKRIATATTTTTTTTTTHTVDLTTVLPSGMSTSVTQMKWPSLLKNEQSKLVNKERSSLGATSLRLQLDENEAETGNLEVSNAGALKYCEEGQSSQEKSENATIVAKAIDDNDISPLISLKLVTEVEHNERSCQVPTSSNSQYSILPTGDTTQQLKKSVAADKGVDVSRIDPCHETPLNATQNSLQHGDGNDQVISFSSNNVLNRNEDPTSNGLTLHCVTRDFISPDHVVEMIGQKHFWNVRRAIIDQQRVFSMQVFELHRIIKVQRIIGGSRMFVMEESHFCRDGISKSSSMTEPTHNLDLENPSSVVRLREFPPKVKLASDSPSQKQPHTGIPTIGQKFGKLGFLSPTGSNTDQGLSAVDPKVVDPIMDNKLPPVWSVPPPVGNQWLVPVMSPSEGLIYKPYKEPSCPQPPAGGYVPTFYGTFGESLTSSRGYNLPVGKSSAGPSYMTTPYGMPVMNPPFSTPAVNNGVILKNRNAVDALPLFPTVPTGCGIVQPVQSAQGSGHKSQVIKVVPRNPRFASESAARIVELIQEERKHLCN